MRVLQLIDHMGSGGAQTIVYDLARLLPERGFDVEVAHLYAPNGFAAQLAKLDVPVHDLSTGGRYSPLAALDPRPMRALRTLLTERSFDLVNVHLYVAPLHARFALLGRPSPHWVNTIHAHRAELPGYVFPSYRFTVSMTDLFIGDFRCSIDEIDETTGGKVPARYIPFGVDMIEPDGTRRAELRREHGIDDGDIVFLSVARLHPQRFIDRFIDSVAAIATAVPNVRLLVVGDGPLRDDLEALADRRRIQDRVSFLGRRDDLSALLGMSDVYLSISRGGDVGVAALQAMSAGVACLAWDNGGLERPIDQVTTTAPFITAATKATFSDAARSIATDETRRREIGLIGRAHVRREHLASTMADRYAAAYRDIVEPTMG